MSNVVVSKVVMKQQKRQLVIHLKSEHIIQRKVLNKVAYDLKKELFGKTSVFISFDDTYELSAAYTLESITNDYWGSILHEVKNMGRVEYSLLANGEWGFEGNIMTILLEDSFLARDKSRVLKEYMEHLFSHRFGKEIQVGFDFTDDAKQAFYKARNHKLNLEVDMVMSQIKKVESEKKENGAEEGETPKEEKKHHNVIFVGRDADGIPRYAHCRGTGEIKYRGDVAGSDKAFGFCHRGTDNQLFVFEAAIDLLSFIQLFPKDWKKRSYLSLGGVSSVALMTFLSERPQITSVFLCLDNDQAGNEACEKLAGEISEGYSVIRLKPSRKDWNEILCDKNTDRKKAIAETITIKLPES